MEYIEQIKAQGFTNIQLVDSFSDEEFTQLEFKDSIGSTHVACFRNDTLVTIIWKLTTLIGKADNFCLSFLFESNIINNSI